MGQYKFSCLIDPTTAAVTKVYNSSGATRPVLLELVGAVTTEQILLKRPLNADPDENKPTHWATRKINDEEQTLREGHTSIAIPVNMLIYIDKPVTANDVGVRIA